MSWWKYPFDTKVVLLSKVEFKDHGRWSSCCPHSYPFATGDTFRAFADVVYDNMCIQQSSDSNCIQQSSDSKPSYVDSSHLGDVLSYSYLISRSKSANFLAGKRLAT